MNLENLSPEQKEIITSNNGPMVVIAGPGTGKTFTIVKKIIYLLIEKRVPPEAILITTFTNKAANELKIRIATELYNVGYTIDTSQLKIGTIHSIALKIIGLQNISVLEPVEQGYLLFKNYNIFKKIQGFQLLETYLNSLKGGFWYNLQQLFNTISENSIPDDKLILSNTKLVRILGLLYSAYIGILEKEGFLDFSQIQNRCLDILEKDEELLKGLHKEIQYLIVDEYQDTNNLQNKILLKLLNSNKNICVVGDDDQSIYRFRGADVKNIINFPFFFESGDCKNYFLKNNYRSPKEIIDFYSSFMLDEVFSGERYKKTLVPVKKAEIGRVFSISSDNHSNLGKKIGEFILQLQEKKQINDLSEISFLFKTTKYGEAKILAQTFKELGLPVFSPRSGDFFKKHEIMILLGMGLALYRDFSQEIFKKNIIELLPHEIYYKKVILEFSNFLKVDKKETESHLKYEDFKNWIKNYNFNSDSMSFIDFFYESLQFSPLKNIFQWTKEDSLFEKDKKWQLHKNISLLLEIINNFENKFGSIYKGEFFNQYLPFLLQSGVNEFEDSEELTLEGHISFLTFHQSKGLEFPIVFLGSLDQSPKKSEKNRILEILNQEYISPLGYDFYKSELKDFYRLYYTGFSRAKEFLFLISKDNREDNSQKYKSPSAIFENIFDKVEKYTEFFNFNPDFSLSQEERSLNRKIFSYTSDVALYTECPIKYRFFRQLKFPQKNSHEQLLGTLVHNTIENLHKDFQKKISINPGIIRDHLTNNYRYLKNSQGFTLDKNLGNKTTEIINNYCNREFENFKDVIGNEVNLTAVREKYILNGVIDILKENSIEEYEILDIKTNQTKPDKVPQNYYEQLLIYGYLAKKNGYPVKKLSLYFTASPIEPKISFDFITKEAELTLQKFDTVIENILKGAFFSRCTDLKKCKLCPLDFYCNKN